MADAEARGRRSRRGSTRAASGKADWKQWGPYLSERQWGTVREDYSEDGNAWDYFTHDQARSRAYRWGEDGLAGISDSKQRLCFALALWNGRDPILKERLFGLTNAEGNHGEDVKEYYFYLDSTPTHSYMKYLYKYPQRRFPYEDLVRTNAARGQARARVRAAGHRRLRRGPLLRRLRRVRQGGPGGHPGPDRRRQPRPGGGDASTCSPRSGSGTPGPGGDGSKPVLGAGGASRGERGRRAPHRLALPRSRCPTTTCTARASPRCSSPRTRPTHQRLWGQPNASPYVKDGINDFVVHGRTDAVNPAGRGTKAAAHVPLTVGPGETRTVRLRLTRERPGADPGALRGPRSASSSSACARPTSSTTASPLRR